MKKKLQHDRIEQILNNIQILNGQREVFLKLLENAKQSASDDITRNWAEYNMAWDKERELERKLLIEYEEKGEDEFINQYVEAVEETNDIWAEEMYLRGIQDAILFFAIANSRSVTDILKK